MIAPRGFAMPLVILLALVVGLMGAVLLERQGAVARLAEREVAAYRDRHYERGVREVIGAWSDSLAGQPLEKMTRADGHVLDLELPTGGGAAVYMFDGQAGFLTDPRGLSAAEREDWAGVMLELQKGRAPGDSSWWRPVGPLAVSAATAPAPILRAIGNYASGGGKSGSRFASELEKARSAGTLTTADLATAMNAADFTPRQRESVARLVTVTPELKAVVVDVYSVVPSGRGTELTRRYGGRMLTPGLGKVSMSMQSLGRFLSWEELPLRE
jgi:hypothetical protein